MILFLSNDKLSSFFCRKNVEPFDQEARQGGIDISDVDAYADLSGINTRRDKCFAACSFV